MCRTRYLIGPETDVRLIDDSPRTDVPCGDVIGWASRTAVDALKFIPGRSVPFIDRPTDWTSLTGVGRINKDHGNTDQFSLVGNKGLQLSKSPISQTCPLTAAGLNSRSDTTQIFESDSPARSVRRLHDGFRDDMINVLLKSGLLAGNLAEFSLGCLGSFSLQVLPSMSVFLTFLFNSLTGVSFPVAIDGEVDDAAIDTENVSGFDKIGLIYVTDDSEIPFAANKHQVNFAFAEGQEFPLSFTADERDFCSTADDPQTYFVVFDKAEDATVVGLGGVFTKGSFNLPVEFIGVGNFGNATDGGLGGQLKPFTNFVVSKFVEIVLSKDPGFPASFGQPVTSSIACFQCTPEQLGLLGRWYQFEIYDEFHASSIDIVKQEVNKNKQFLPRINPWVSLLGAS